MIINVGVNSDWRSNPKFTEFYMQARISDVMHVEPCVQMMTAEIKREHLNLSKCVWSCEEIYPGKGVLAVLVRGPIEREFRSIVSDFVLAPGQLRPGCSGDQHEMTGGCSNC